MRRVTAIDELRDLSVGSIIVDLGPRYAMATSPVVACKTTMGWQVMGLEAADLWTHEQVFKAAGESELVVAYDALEGVRAAIAADTRPVFPWPGGRS